jgi:cobalt-zinc-cadmium efflux system outer membrane protein
MTGPAVLSLQRLIGCCALVLLAGCAHYTPKPISLANSSDAFDSRSLTNADVQAFVAAHLTNQSAKAWTFEALTLVAFYYNPGLQIARAQNAGATAGSVTAKARPNPTIGLAPGYDFNAISPASPWIPGMTIDYPIETAGKRGKRILVARFNAEAARFDIAAAAWQVRSNVRSAMIEVSAARCREHLLARQLTNQSGLLRLLQQRFEAGAIARYEVAPYEIGRLKLQGDQAAARAAAIHATAHLADALGIPAKALVDLEIEPISAAAEAPANISELRARALRNRADLLALLARYEAAQAALQLEIAKQYPDLRLGSGYQWDQGESKWTINLNLEIPIFNRNQGPIAEAEARRRQMAAQVLEAQARMINEIDRAASALSAAREESQRARESLTALEQQARLVRERVLTGGADQVEALAASLDQDAASLIALEAEIRLATAGADLEFALQSTNANIDVAEKALSSSP